LRRGRLPAVPVAGARAAAPAARVPGAVRALRARAGLLLGAVRHLALGRLTDRQLPVGGRRLAHAVALQGDDLEAAGDEVGRRAVEVAPAREALLDRVEARLPAGEALVGGTDVLEEQQPPVRGEDSLDLGEHA